MTTGFFSWRWAPAVALVGGATVLAVAATVFIPRSIGTTGAGTAPALAPAARRNDGASHANDGEVEVTASTKEASRRRVERASESTPAAGVESFFPAVPEVAALPPPLPDDPVPPEPVNTQGNREVFGPGVEPSSMPIP
jgi:hypothetical protein